MSELKEKTRKLLELKPVDDNDEDLEEDEEIKPRARPSVLSSTDQKKKSGLLSMLPPPKASIQMPFVKAPSSKPVESQSQDASFSKLYSSYFLIKISLAFIK